MEFEITTFSIDDYDSMLNVWQEAGLPFKPVGRDSREEIARQMQADPGMFICCRAEERIVGVVIGTTDGRRGYVNRLAVVPEWRRKGVANALVDAVEKHLKSRGLGIVTVLVENQSQESMELFKKRGYFFHEDIHYLSKRESQDV